jgi:hypothetical protein
MQPKYSSAARRSWPLETVVAFNEPIAGEM